MLLPTQTMHYWGEIPANNYHTLALFDKQRMIPRVYEEHKLSKDPETGHLFTYMATSYESQQVL